MDDSTAVPTVPSIGTVWVDVRPTEASIKKLKKRLFADNEIVTAESLEKAIRTAVREELQQALGSFGARD
jgi:hypothetical protein